MLSFVSIRGGPGTFDLGPQAPEPSALFEFSRARGRLYMTKLAKHCARAAQSRAWVASSPASKGERLPVLARISGGLDYRPLRSYGVQKFPEYCSARPAPGALIIRLLARGRVLL